MTSQTIEITEGYYKGRFGTIIEEGTFNTFGRSITGVKVDTNLAGHLILAAGEYRVIGAPTINNKISFSDEEIAKVKAENDQLIKMIFGNIN